ncbi:AAA domain-containing protein [Prosthecobacter debontii]|uniref:AAA domain-containing protein n=1 Tax=Prosthecobacter debontii TaxID=48467 RepID=A0A1T4YED7_9BACT|nr:AAA family ATPase [Prosthecobacter debontii]SKB00124.1 AAA domain-containing protein [Prosthecobacter debontii]
MRLTKLTLKNFAPFADGEMDFPAVEGEDTEGLAEVHLFTGENGTGKTRVLAALMGALGNLNPLQDRVRQDSGAEIEVWGKTVGKTTLSSYEGSWGYRNGAEDPAKPSFPIQHDIAFALAGTSIALLDDVKVSAGAEIKPARVHETLNISGSVGGVGILQRLMNLRMQVALERDANGAATQGRMTSCLTQLEQAISTISGKSFSIVVKPGREIRLMAMWGDVELYFSELPDGMRSLLNWLAGWVVLQAEHYDEAEAPLNEPVVLILDEPENHLHPAWQRRVLPAVQKLFPKAQMFVVTHSPFVVSSLNVGWIHKFTRNSQGRVEIEPPKAASRGDSYMTAVQEVLDLAEWFDPETEQEIADFEAALDKAYENNGSSVNEMRRKADKLAQRSQEVTNLVMGLVAQFDRTAAAREKSVN